jgi:putative membrane protein
MPSEHRLHPSSILFAFAGSVKRFALPALLAMVTSSRTSGTPPFMGRWAERGPDLSNFEFWLLLLLIPSALAAIATYLSFRIRYEGTEIVIRSGIIFRNERHVPYHRIQNLDAVRNVAHRVLGVTEVRVETGGGKAPEATIRVLHNGAFDQMRRRVIEGRARVGAPAPAADGAALADAEPTVDVAAPPLVRLKPDTTYAAARTLLHLPPRELLLHGFLDNRGLLVVGAAYGVLWEFGLLRGVWNQLFANDGYAPAVVSQTVRRLSAGQTPPAREIAVLVLVVGSLLVLVRVLSMVWAATRLHDFRLTRAGGDLRTEYGLLTRVTATIPARRVQTVTVHDGPLQRLAGRMAVRVETAGGQATPQQGFKSDREWLAPIVRASAVPALVREVSSLDLETLPWQPVHPRAFRRAVKPALLIGIAVIAPLLGAFGWRALAVLPFSLAWMTFVSWKQVHAMAWAATGDAVAFRSGWLWRNVTVAPVGKIQAVACWESPLDRRAAMARVRVDTAGASERSHRVDIPYLARETANTLHRRLSTQAAQTVFHWS